MNERESRSVVDAELRVSQGSGKTLISGYAALYDSPSELLWGVREVIRPGAFDAVLKNGPDVRALFNHDVNHVLGRTTAGTARIWADKRGLGYEIQPPDTPQSAAVLESIRRGDVSGSSFSFGMDWEDDEAQSVTQENGQPPLREIRKVSELYDVGPVVFPAYPETVSETVQRSILARVRPGVSDLRRATKTAALRLQLRQAQSNIRG